MIVCGDGINYIFNEAKQPFHVFLALIAIHYAFDLHYLAGYGLLYVVEEYCITRPLMAIGGLSKKKRSDIPSCVGKFIESLDKAKGG